MIAKECPIVAFFLFIFTLAAFCNETPWHYQCIEKNGHEYHVLEVSPQYYKVIAMKAEGTLRKKVGEFVKAQDAFAGINGGFFHLTQANDALPAGALKINKRWISKAKLPRAAIGWSNDNPSVLIDRIKTNKNDEVFPQQDRSDLSKALWQQVDYIVGGTPLLIKNSKIISQHAPERVIKSFLDEKHARSAICIKKNKHWVFLAVPHTKESDRAYSTVIKEGVTIAELSNFMLEQGCVDAINLDGGGSTALVLGNKTLNQPAGDRIHSTAFYLERPVLDVILILEK